jgi:hypothetical protein
MFFSSLIKRSILRIIFVFVIHLNLAKPHKSLTLAKLDTYKCRIYIYVSLGGPLGMVHQNSLTSANLTKSLLDKKPPRHHLLHPPIILTFAATTAPTAKTAFNATANATAIAAATTAATCHPPKPLRPSPPRC